MRPTPLFCMLVTLVHAPRMQASLPRLGLPASVVQAHMPLTIPNQQQYEEDSKLLAENQELALAPMVTLLQILITLALTLTPTVDANPSWSPHANPNPYLNIAPVVRSHPQALTGEYVVEGSTVAGSEASREAQGKPYMMAWRYQNKNARRTYPNHDTRIVKPHGGYCSMAVAWFGLGGDW